MAEQGSSDADIASSALANERRTFEERVTERKSRAGRVKYIGFAVETQRMLSGISAAIKLQMADAVDHYNDYMTPEQKTKLFEARAHTLDAADKLHSVASELVGEMKKEN